jgi:hypothetical protein
MLERVCPQCGAANAAEQPRCHACGSSINQSLQRSPRAALATRRVQLPVQWQQTGRVVALGLLSVAAEAGLYWLSQRRQQRPATERMLEIRHNKPDTGSVIPRVLQQRIVERWANGQLQERTIERTVWLEPDK